MAVVQLDGPGEFTHPEIRAREAKLGITTTATNVEV
ncbi:hypothetical protein PanWU01x14_087420 [Parasponia andersonii]|uniref:Uncharacterized protein n=1 Tax=Parasponia andersonii TaxID=3476 RepID=A0A2P5D8I2_PARAD|nr:hypothetical protein PanWU01x14_087420 [Parasponia andersonii]